MEDSSSSSHTANGTYGGYGSEDTEYMLHQRLRDLESKFSTIRSELHDIRSDHSAFRSVMEDMTERLDAKLDSIIGMLDKQSGGGGGGGGGRSSTVCIDTDDEASVAESHSGRASGKRTPLNRRKRAESSVSSRPDLSVLLENVALQPSLSFHTVPIRLWAGSWNVGAKDPFSAKSHLSEEDLSVLATPGTADVYVLAVQEGVSDDVFHAFGRFVCAKRLPLHQLSSGARMSEQADRVLGRGDGSFRYPKFTGIAVFVAPELLEFVHVMATDKLSFGKTEGSKGGAGVVLRIHDTTIACISCHLASKKLQSRLVQYKDISKQLGGKLGNQFFQLQEQFHHVLWMGDFNYRCSGVAAPDLLQALENGGCPAAFREYDSMTRHRKECHVWHGFVEPPMAPDFYPTYKKYEQLKKGISTQKGWTSQVYHTEFKEPLYKGGRIKSRIPGWCDRIVYYSMRDVKGNLRPIEVVRDPHGLQSSYRAINDELSISDHSPVVALFSLEAAVANTVSPFQGIRNPSSDSQRVYGTSPMFRELSASSDSGIIFAPDTLGSLGQVNSSVARRPSDPYSGNSSPNASPTAAYPIRKYSFLEPDRPLEDVALRVVLRVSSVHVEVKHQMKIPKLLKVLFPAPYESIDGLDYNASKEVRVAPKKGKVSATLSFDGAALHRFARLHLLMKAQLDRNLKGHCVVSVATLVESMSSTGDSEFTYFEPLHCDGLPLMDASGRQLHAQFKVSMKLFASNASLQSGMEEWVP